MENASKALIISGAVLIAIMLISLGVYVFSQFSNFTKKQEQEIFNKDLAQFNSQFTKYIGSKTITKYDIVSIANLAKDNNIYYGLDEEDSSTNYIRVDYNYNGTGGSFSQRNIEKKSTEWLSNLIIKPNTKNFYIKEILYNNIGRVNYIYFENVKE